MDNNTEAYRLQQWTAAIQDRAISGLTVDEWCELHSVGRNQYYYRLRKVREAAAQHLSLTPACTPDTHTVFAEVSLPCSDQQTPSAPTHDQQMPSASVCIRTGDAEILVTNDASEELLARVLKAVRSC